MSKPSARSRRNPLLQSARDFIIGLGLFALVHFASSYLPDQQAASTAPLFSTSAFAAAPHASWAVSHPIQPDGAIFRSTDEREATIILGLAFAALVAFDLALLRHLRRVYASPR